MQHVQTLVLDGVFLHLLLPCLVQRPHIPCGQKRGARKRPVRQRGVTRAPCDFFILGALCVQQQEPDADVAGARGDAAGPHGDFDPLSRTREQGAHGFSGAEADRVTVFLRRDVAAAVDAYLGELRQITRIDGIVKVGGDAREQNDISFRDPPVHIKFAAVDARLLPVIGGVGNLSGLRILKVSADGDAAFGNSRACRTHRSRRPGRNKMRRTPLTDLSMPIRSAAMAPALGRSGYDAAPGKGTYEPLQAAHAVIGIEAIVGDERRVVQGNVEYARNQADLFCEVFKVHPASGVSRGVSTRKRASFNVTRDRARVPASRTTSPSVFRFAPGMNISHVIPPVGLMPSSSA